ncbi:DNA cytosine methyltransferase [Glaciimonas sp. GG7]
MGHYYEFFAGGGMVNAGLGKSWQCLFANDLCEKKASSYRANWGNNHLVVCDVASIKTNQLPGKADLAWASFPCQDLSLAGNGLGLDGERSGTFWAFIKLMKQLSREGRRPQIIALENVYGALTSHAGKDFEAIINAVTDAGYLVGAMIIDAVHFVPHSRPRLFIIGIDDRLPTPQDLVAENPNPAWHAAALIKAHNRLPGKLKDKWLWWNLPVPSLHLKTLDDIIEKNPKGVAWHSDEQTSRLLEMMTYVNRQKVMLAQQARQLKIGTIYRRMRDGVQRAEVRFDGIAGCLRTPKGGSSRQTIISVNGSVIRSRLLSPREAARLMGLDDSYVLPERYNDAYHLAGDGVPVPVVAYLARNIFEPVLAVSHQLSLIDVA